MSAILTLNFKYQAKDRAWFNKEFNTYAELTKWLREDSIIVLPSSELVKDNLEKKLILTKLALPRILIIIITNNNDIKKSSFFKIIQAEKLDNEINKAIINHHEIIDNRINLQEVIKIFT